jgi:hypothetical protein
MMMSAKNELIARAVKRATMPVQSQNAFGCDLFIRITSIAILPEAGVLTTGGIALPAKLGKGGGLATVAGAGGDSLAIPSLWLLS